GGAALRTTWQSVPARFPPPSASRARLVSWYRPPYMTRLTTSAIFRPARSYASILTRLRFGMSKDTSVLLSNGLGSFWNRANSPGSGLPPIGGWSPPWPNADALALLAPPLRLPDRLR